MTSLTDFQADVLGKVTAVRGKSAGRIAEQLGFETYHGVSRALGTLVDLGFVTKTDKGYVLA